MPKFDAALIKRNQKALKQAAPLFDRINHAWDEIEDFFRKQGVLRPASFTYRNWSESNGQGEWGGQRLLGVEKVKGKWRICHGDLYDNGPLDVSWMPMAECGIELRIEMLEYVGELFAVMVKSNEEYIAEIEQAVALSDEVLANLGLSE